MDAIEYIKGTKLQAWVAIFLLLSTVFIQYADIQTGEFQKKLNKWFLQASNHLEICTNYQISAGVTTFLQFLPYDKISEENIKGIIIRHADLRNQLNLKSEETDKWSEQLEKGEIDLKTYFSKSTNWLNEKIIFHKNAYNKKMTELQGQEKTGTPWTKVKTVLFPLQMVCVLLLGFFKFQKEVIVKKNNEPTEQNIRKIQSKKKK